MTTTERPTMAEPTWSRMDLKEFHESGLLAHVNQTALWHFGLALTVAVDRNEETGETEYLELYVQRLDPYEGIISGDSVEEQEERMNKLVAWIIQRTRKRVRRG